MVFYNQAFSVNLNSLSANHTLWWNTLKQYFGKLPHNLFKCLIILWDYSKGLVTHNDILKIYRNIQYSKNIYKCNMVKNVLTYIKRSHFYSKNNFCIMNKIKLVWFYSLYRSFWVKHNKASLVQNMLFYFLNSIT